MVMSKFIGKLEKEKCLQSYIFIRFLCFQIYIPNEMSSTQTIVNSAFY